MDKEWNPEKGMFEITEYKEIDGVKQIVKSPVPILKTEEAQNRYHKELSVNNKPSDPNWITLNSTIDLHLLTKL